MQTKELMMRAAVLEGPRRYEIKQVVAPEPGPGCVRVRLEGCGVCGSNLAPWQGRPWTKYPFEPGSPGHEAWGSVEKVGPGVSSFKPGQRVTLLSFNAFAEFDVANENMLVPLPGILDGQPFPGEAVGCAVNVFNRCGIQAGQTVAVIGVGFLGALLVSLASGTGATVYAISRRSCALQVAKELGAQRTLCQGERASVVNEIMHVTSGKGCDCVIEATGQPGPLELAGELTRIRGRLVVAGYHQETRQVNMQLWNWRGVDVINAHERDSSVYISGIRAAVQATIDSRLNPVRLCTHSFGLEEINSAFQLLEQRPDGFFKSWIRL